jgi:hypothetical protein
VEVGKVKEGNVGVALGVGVRVCTPLDGEVGVREGWMIKTGGVGEGKRMM